MAVLAVIVGFANAEESTSTSTSTIPTQTATATNATTTPVPPIVKDIKESELRQELSIKEIYGRVICRELGKCPLAEAKPSTEALMKASKVTEIGAGYIKVSIFGYSYKVDMANSKIVRQYWGESSVDEFSVGDIVNVFGYLDPLDNYLVHAQNVRNVSIQKVNDVFKGSIESINSSDMTFVLKTDGRGNQTVVVSSLTKIVRATGTASFADLQVGMKVVVRGLWNKTLSRINADVIVIGGGGEVRAFFKATGEKVEKALEKAEEKLEKTEEKVAKKEEKGGNTEGLKAKIDEIQKKINELLNKLRGTSSTPTTTTSTTTNTTTPTTTSSGTSTNQ